MWRDEIIVAILIISFFLIPVVIQYFSPPIYPVSAELCKLHLEAMSDDDYILRLKKFCAETLNDSIDGLNYTQLLEWEHRHLKYSNETFKRRNRAIDILNVTRGEDGKALGRCGEFALLYYGLLVANNYTCRVVIDFSVKTDNRTAGDHVWNEVLIGGEWIHIDPTERIIDKPKMYVEEWNKNVNYVLAITSEEIVEVTDKYA